jgi:hypothetical protein
LAAGEAVFTEDLMVLYFVFFVQACLVDHVVAGPDEMVLLGLGLGFDPLASFH